MARGGAFTPHISFSPAGEKETCRARYKEKERLERPCEPKAASFSFVLYILKTGSLVLGGLVLPLAPLPLTGTGGQAAALEPLGPWYYLERYFPTATPCSKKTSLTSL